MHRAGGASFRVAPVSSTLGLAIHMNLLVRRLEPEDLFHAQALWRATPGIGLSSADEIEALSRFLQRNPGMSFVAERMGQLIGTVLCGHDGRRGFVHHLVVAQDARRAGLGQRLLRCGLDALKTEGIEKCHLLVFDNNPEGLAFWRSLPAAERSELVVFSLNTGAA